MSDRIIDCINQLQQALAEAGGSGQITLGVDSETYSIMLASTYKNTYAPPIPNGFSNLIIWGSAGQIKIMNTETSPQNRHVPIDKKSFVKEAFGMSDEEIEEIVKK